MSYLTTPNLPEFSKCVISFWVRVPQAAMDAAQQEQDDFDNQDDPGDPPPLLGLVPFLVFGQEGTGPSSSEPQNSFTSHTESTTFHTCGMHVTYGGSFPTATVNWYPECFSGGYTEEWFSTTVSYSTTPGKPTNPSYIAVDGGGNLQCNFESTQLGDFSGNCGLLSAEGAHITGGHLEECCTYEFLSGCDAGGDSYTAPGTDFCSIMLYVFWVLTYRLLTAVAANCIFDGSSGHEHVDGKLTSGPIPGDMGTGALNFGPQGAPLSGDTWHHVMVSVDMSSGCASSGSGGISQSCTAYVAIDDVDYKTGIYPLEDTNQVVTAGCSVAAATEGGGDCPPGSYSIGSMTVPSAPVGIPCVEKYVGHIRKIEMAELLFFTDVVLDTSQEENRRLFITAPGKDGKQIPTNPSPVYVPTTKTAVGDPPIWDWSTGPDTPAFVPPLSSLDPTHKESGNKQLGTPEIGFAASSIPWQSPMNLGKLKGDVVKTGRIKAYFPDPSIGGDAPAGG